MTASGLSGCRYCGSDRLVTTPCNPQTPRYARTECADCKRFLRWEPAPMTPERAAAFVLPIWQKKHKGKRLDQIPRVDLYWLVKRPNLKPSIARAILCYLNATASPPQ